ncbi:Protein kinase superfamily protein [Trifolium repens]|nr:Protein kinase superfamily protein [Trifolium repens]
MDYETVGYRWLAPEIIAGGPESVTETWMSNVYSFGIVIWEMVFGDDDGALVVMTCAIFSSSATSFMLQQVSSPPLLHVCLLLNLLT